MSSYPSSQTPCHNPGAHARNSHPQESWRWHNVSVTLQSPLPSTDTSVCTTGHGMVILKMIYPMCKGSLHSDTRDRLQFCEFQLQNL